MKILGWVGTAILTMWGSAACAADLPANERLCKEQDLIGGTWAMIQFQETPPRKEASLVAAIPHHYLAFYPDHYYGFVAIDREMKTPTEVQKALSWSQKTNPPRVLKYALDKTGVLDLYIDKRVNYSYRCVAVQASVGGYMKNDLILTGYTRGGKTQLYKLYRRWF